MSYTLLINAYNNGMYAHLISMLLSQRMIFTVNDEDYSLDINLRRNNATNIYVFISDTEEANELVTVCNKTTSINETMPMQDCFDRINELFT